MTAQFNFFGTRQLRAFAVLLMTSGICNTAMTQDWVSLGVSGDTCSIPINHSYTYQNFSSGTGSGYHGHYKIFKDGQLVFTSEDGYVPALNLEYLYVRSGDMIVAGTTWGQCMRTTNGMATFEQFGSLIWIYFIQEMYFPAEGLGYALNNGAGVSIQRIGDPGWEFIFQSPSANLPADTVVHDTVPAFVSCTDVDTLTFSIRRNSLNDTARIHIVLHQSQVGIQEAAQTLFCQVTPNPVSEEIKLPCIAAGSIGEYSICAVDGRIVSTGNISAFAKGISVAEFDDGPYVLVLSSNGRRTATRFVKSH